MRKKSLKVLAAAAALALPVSVLSGCNSRAGVALESENYTITEAELSAVSADLGSLLVDTRTGQIERAQPLIYSMLVHNGGEKLLQNNCPDVKQSVEVLRVQKDLDAAELSEPAAKIVRLLACTVVADDEAALLRGKLRISAPDSHFKSDFQQLFKKTVLDQTVSISPRYEELKKELLEYRNLAAQQAQSQS